MLEEKASNSNFDGHDDLVQSPRRFGKPPNNTSIAVGKTTKINFRYFVEVKLDIMVVAGLKV